MEWEKKSQNDPGSINAHHPTDQIVTTWLPEKDTQTCQDCRSSSWEQWIVADVRDCYVTKYLLSSSLLAAAWTPSYDSCRITDNDSLLHPRLVYTFTITFSRLSLWICFVSPIFSFIVYVICVQLMISQSWRSRKKKPKLLQNFGLEWPAMLDRQHSRGCANWRLHTGWGWAFLERPTCKAVQVSCNVAS